MTHGAHELDKEQQERFWTENQEPLKGENVAHAVLRLAGRRALGRRALDVGAGSGAILRAYRKRVPGADVVGIDLAPKSPEVLKGDCTALAFTDASFDTVTCTDVLEHLPDADLESCVREIARVLRPGGHLVACTPNEERLSEQSVGCPECGTRFHRWGHCQVMSEPRVRELLGRHGLRVTRVRRTHLGLRAGHPVLTGIFYALRLERFVKAPTLIADLLVVARRE
jgi:2-polyprenyl-3-methyl-5-hydroxy-6-metoxy-1,4-benzoquinol methylase